MTWTILILILAIALFVFSGFIVRSDSKKASVQGIIMHRLISVVAIALIAGCVCRLWTPVYLTQTNPEILQEMVASMQAQQEAAKSKELRRFVEKHMDDMIGFAPIAGNVDAGKTIFLFSDYSCPFCRRVHAELSRVLKERNDVRVVLKNFSIHGALSDAPAKAVIAAKLQGNDKAAALDKMLMDKEYYGQEEAKNAYSKDKKDQEKAAKAIEANVMKLAKEAGLDTKKLAEDMKGDTVAMELDNVRDLAERFEIRGTPFLIIGTKSFPGAIPYSKIIEALK